MNDRKQKIEITVPPRTEAQIEVQRGRVGAEVAKRAVDVDLIVPPRIPSEGETEVLERIGITDEEFEQAQDRAR